MKIKNKFLLFTINILIFINVFSINKMNISVAAPILNVDKKIMIVEDDKGTRLKHAKLVSKTIHTDYAIVQAEHGLEAYEKITAEPNNYVLIITDHNIGGGKKDELEMIKKLKNNHKTKHIP
nr:hypothetical protein [Nitrosopumilus sp.]